MVDRIRYPTVSYLPFYYVFFQFLLLTIFKFTSQYIDNKGHTLKPGRRRQFCRKMRPPPAAANFVGK